MKRFVDDEGTITYSGISGKKTIFVVQQDPYHRKLGLDERGIWYVFRITPRKVLTEFEGSKQDSISYAERAASSLEKENKGKKS